jgi:hypothetical protein
VHDGLHDTVTSPKDGPSAFRDWWIIDKPANQNKSTAEFQLHRNPIRLRFRIRKGPYVGHEPLGAGGGYGSFSSSLQDPFCPNKSLLMKSSR